MGKQSKRGQKNEKFVIGWNEMVDLPEWKIFRIKAKVDTGARSSSIHVEDIKRLSGNRVSFFVVLDKHHSIKRKKITGHIARKSHVKPSHGISSKRIFVKTKIRLGPVEREIELNLVDRKNMAFRMLIGRTAFGGHFLVDVSHSRVLSRKKVQKAQIVHKKL